MMFLYEALMQFLISNSSHARAEKLENRKKWRLPVKSRDLINIIIYYFRIWIIWLTFVVKFKKT